MSCAEVAAFQQFCLGLRRVVPQFLRLGTEGVAFLGNLGRLHPAQVLASSPLAGRLRAHPAQLLCILYPNTVMCVLGMCALVD